MERLKRVLTEHILNYTDDIIFILNGSYRLLDVNKKAESSLGYKKDEFLDKRITDFIVERDKWNEYVQSLDNTNEIMGSLRFIHKNKSCIRYDVLIVKVFDPGIDFNGFLIFAKDISRWINFEENLLRIDRLVELGQIAAGIIHELKNPLTIIDQAVGWGKTLVDDKKELSSEDMEEVRHIFEEISKQADRCRNITHQVLSFVREKTPEEKKFDIIKLLEDTLKYIEPEIKYLPVKIEKDFPEGSVYVVSDYNLLEQVLVNLFINAVDAIKEKKAEEHRLGLKIKVLPTTIQIYISDTGPGIPPEIQDKIFDLFFTTKPSGKGTGLGLAITRSIVERLGGEIFFETEKDKGTTFVVTLPKNE